MKEFKKKVIDLLEIVDKEESTNIKLVAEHLFDCFIQNGLVHIFATGHSHMFAEEMFYRAGGLVPVNPIFFPALMQHEGAIRSTKLERLSGLAKEIFDSVEKDKNDPFLIVSNSGINNVPVEMAMLAKEQGHLVIAVTSKNASLASTPRTISQKRLCEIADIVIDTHVPLGDGVMEYNGTKIGAVSSIIGSYIAQNIVLEIIDLYEKKGITPPIYKSANTLGGDSHNKKLYEQYKKRIHSLY